MIRTSIAKQETPTPPAILNSYFPQAPLIMRGTVFADQIAEMMMFRDPRIPVRMASNPDWQTEKNLWSDETEKHLQWLVAKSELRTPQMQCPFCGLKNVSQALAVRDKAEYMKGFFFDIRLVSCEDCTEALEKEGSLEYFKYFKKQVIPLRFSEIAKLPLDTRKIQDFLMEVFDVGELTPETAFQFFNK